MGYTTSPLRYPGGKTRLAGFIKHVLVSNDLLGGEYVEPYAGGAGIAWSLLFQDYVAHVHINDLSQAVYAFWLSLFEHTDELCKLIWDTPVTIDTWFKQRAILTDALQHSTLEVGFATFFLNRTNRSGIIWGGVIGGKNQKSKWKLDARYNRQNLVKRVEKIAQYRAYVSIYNTDAIDFLTQVLPKLPDRSLIYLDPPYYAKGSDLYENHYEDKDHVAIAKSTTSLERRWIISYDDTTEIRQLYKGHRCMSYHLSYSAADRYRGSEVMFFSPTLDIPNVDSPLGLKVPRSPSKK